MLHDTRFIRFDQDLTGNGHGSKAILGGILQYLPTESAVGYIRDTFQWGRDE